MSDSNDKRIFVTRSSMPELEEYVREIAPLWETRWLTNMGDKHEELSRQLRGYLDVPNVTLYTNGHSALECALEVFGLQGKVITTPFTFASTTHAIVRKGLTPVFCDIKPTDFTMDPEKIESLIDEDTVAIMPVHVYGNLCDVDAIARIAEAHGLKVIYDAAHAFGVKKDGVSAANFGDISMFSFHATKVFHTIEGGALTFKDDALKKKLDQWKNFGIVGPENVEYAGGNAKMNEFCAAMGICNLRHVDADIAARRVLSERYFENLSGIDGLRMNAPASGVEHNYAYMPVVFEDAFGATRDEVHAALDENGITARKYFYPLTNAFECYAGKFDPHDTPVALDVASRVLTLPLYPDLQTDEVDRICEVIRATARA